MIFASFERAQVAAFAYREARETGNLDCLRAICFVIRNRVRAGWGDGSWLSVLETAHLVADSHPSLELDLAAGKPHLGTDRLLQGIVRDIDDIYLNQDHFDDPVRNMICGDNKKPSLYYKFVNRPTRPWFVQNIIWQPLDHPSAGTIGQMMFYR